MKTTLIFDVELRGHHLEYLHHLYMGYSTHTDQKYIFVLHKDFLLVKDRLCWPEYEHIQFDFFEIGINEDFSFVGKIVTSYKLSKLVGKYVKKYNAENVFFIFLMSFIPWLPFLLPSKVNVSGILYRIYLFDWEQYNLLQKVAEVLRFSLLRFSKCISKIYVLNSRSCTRTLNKIWKCNKFYYLPDPFVKLESVEKIWKDGSIISPNKKMLLHFGSLMRRKGTLQILDSIQYFNESDRGTYVFVFAGKVDTEIKREFYEKLAVYKDKVQILVYDEFCSFEFISTLVESAACVLMPYFNTSQSSGLLGYAIQFAKPVIVPKRGMLAKIIKESHNGIYLNSISPKEIYNSVQQVKHFKVDKDLCNLYITAHSVDEFVRVICD